MRAVRVSGVTLALIVALSALPRLQDAPTRPTRTVVVDPGHGGDDIGVRGPGGLEEKQLTLDIARRLRTAIEAGAALRVVLTRDEDRAVPPDERAAAANAASAAVFLSLHANAAPSASVAGAEVYYSALDPGQGDLPALVPSPILLVPWDEAQARQFDGSGRLAALVHEELQGSVPMSARSIRQAPLRVFRGATMPAVLVEMLFLTNPDQEKAAATTELKDAIAAALTRAVSRFDVGGGAAPQP
jgi:N-acetylmuramoyl-L-alanine amidase